MPKIHIQGEPIPRIVSAEDAERISRLKNDPNHKGMIRIGQDEIQKGKIKQISFSNEAKPGGYDLNNPAEKATIVAFEKELEKLKNAELSGPIEFYGKFFSSKCPEIVINDILGGVHWTIVQYALRRGFISRDKNGNWAIVSHSLDPKEPAISEYLEFAQKLKALKDLSGRRNFVAAQNLKLQDRAIEEFANQTEMPETGVLPF